MMKICLIIHSLGIGGMERVMHQLAVSFSKKENVELHLILIGRKREIVYEIPNSIYLHKPHFQFDNSRRIIDTLRTIFFLRGKVKDIAPKTILSFGEYWNNLVLLSLYGLSYPVYISDRSEPNKYLGRVQNFLRDILYPKAAGYIAQTEAAKKICFSKEWNRNVRVIGNPIRKVNTPSGKDNENIVLSIGRLIKTKHFDQLIKMFVEIGKPEWRLVIVGGDAKNMCVSTELNDLIHQLGAEGTVYLEGEQKHIDRYYNKSKIFAFTSSSEGFPNVIGEALSAGLPVVSYDCVAGPSDMIVNEENGYLIPLFDQESFKNSLRLLMEDRNLRNRFGVKGKESILSFSVENISEQFYRFITDRSTI